MTREELFAANLAAVQVQNELSRGTIDRIPNVDEEGFEDYVCHFKTAFMNYLEFLQDHDRPAK